MPRIKLSALLILSLLSIGTANADDSDAYLRAITKRDASICYTVMDADKRTMCIAEIKREPALCYSVFDPVIRDLCMARAKMR